MGLGAAMSFMVHVSTHTDESAIDLTLGNRRSVPVPHGARFEAGESVQVDILVDRVPRRVTFFYRPIFDVTPEFNDPEIADDASPLHMHVKELTERGVIRVNVNTDEGLAIDDIHVDSDPL